MAGPRHRAPRGTLNRERIVDTAVAIADEEGIAGLSMPKLARRLGVGAMSLYTHVASKDELVDAVAQRLLAQVVTLDAARPSGIAGVRDHFRALRKCLVAHPGLGEVFATRGVTVPAVFDLLERNLAHLVGLGLDDESAVRLYYALLTYTLGFATWQLPRAALDDAAYRDRWHAILATLSTEAFPTVHELQTPLATVASDAQFEFGLLALTRELS